MFGDKSLKYCGVNQGYLTLASPCTNLEEYTICRK